MIDIARIQCTPMALETVPTYIVGSETNCPRNWSGQYVSPSQPYRTIQLRWTDATEASAQALRQVIDQSLSGHRQVVYTPPTDPAGLSLTPARASQQPTVVGRLRPPFRIRQRGFNKYDMEVTLEEDH